MNDENKYWILFELQDAQEALTQITNDLKNDDDYGETEHQINMAHLFSHVNSAWNMRVATTDEVESGEKFDEWARFPDDIKPLQKSPQPKFRLRAFPYFAFLRARQLPQHVLQNAAVQIIIHLNRRINAHANWHILR